MLLIRKVGATTSRQRRSYRQGAASFKHNVSLAGICLLVGMAIGAAAGYMLARNSAGTGKATTVTNVSKISKTQGKKITVASETSSNRYDFYNILPHEDNHKKEESIKDRDTASAVGYLIQGGSFLSLSDADALKAHLALIGVESSIEVARIRSGSKRYRVLIGPFATEKLALAKKQTLKDLDIKDTLILRRKVKGD